MVFVSGMVSEVSPIPDGDANCYRMETPPPEAVTIRFPAAA
jgi:hypothetical protein